MFADRVYEQNFLAAMADRGFYVFTSPVPSAAARLIEPRSARMLLSELNRADAEPPPAAPPLAEAA